MSILKASARGSTQGGEWGRGEETRRRDNTKRPINTAASTESVQANYPARARVNAGSHGDGL